jgi:hypothetical protein
MSLVMATAPGLFDQVGQAASGLDQVFKAIGDAIGTAAATVKVAMWNMVADVLAAYGVIIAKIPELATTTQTVTEQTKNYFDGLFNDIATGFGNTIQQWLAGATTFKDFMLDIWGNIKDAFFRMVGEMIAEWIVNFAKKIIDSTVDVAASITKNVGGALGGMADAAGKMASGFLSALGSVGSIISGITSVISLLKGPQKQTDVTYWLKLQWELLQNSYNFFVGKLTWMLESIPSGVRYLNSIKEASFKISTATQLTKDRLQSVISGLKTCANYLRSIDVGISKLPHAASGGVFTRPTLAHIAEREPEIVMPLRDYRAEAVQATGRSGPVVVNIRPVVIDKKDRYLIEFIQEGFDHNVFRIPTASVGG